MAKAEASRHVASTASKNESPRANPKPYRVLVVDDHAVVRHGVRLLLASQPGIEICGEAGNGADAVALAKREKPDLAVMDLTMPDMTGLEALRDIREALPETEVLVLSMHFPEDIAREVLRCGALAYVLKSDADSDLLAALDHVRHHQPYFTTRLQVSMAETYVRRPGERGTPGAEEAPDELPLTARELQVVQLLAEGKSNKEVATVLNVSTRTVESHRNHVMHKMNFTSFSDLVRFAIRNKLAKRNPNRSREETASSQRQRAIACLRVGVQFSHAGPSPSSHRMYLALCAVPRFLTARNEYGTVEQETRGSGR